MHILLPQHTWRTSNIKSLRLLSHLYLGSVGNKVFCFCFFSCTHWHFAKKKKQKKTKRSKHEVMDWQVTHWLDSSGNCRSASSAPHEPTWEETFSGDWQHAALHLTEPEVFFCALRCPIVQSGPAVLTALAPGLNKLTQKGRLIRCDVCELLRIGVSVNVP